MMSIGKHLEDLAQFFQSFGALSLGFLVVPVLIAGVTRNIVLTLAAILLSFASSMLFIAPASAISGLAVATGVASYLAALESVVARRRTKALNNEIAELTMRVNRLESAEQRRLALEVKGRSAEKQTWP
jgi:hypothetical protein